MDSFSKLWFSPLLALLIAGQVDAQKDTFDRESLKVKDSVVLKSGSRLFGDIRKTGTDDDGRKYILFDTADGGRLKLDLARMVYRGKVKETDEIDEQYNQHIATLADEPDAHWELYRWCEDQPSGKVRFSDQMQFHLERIMHLDPNDDQAKRELGYHYIREQDRWVPEDRYHQSLGYERKGTSWAPVLQRVVDQRHEKYGSIEGSKKGDFRVWLKAVKKPNPDVAALRAELFRICDATSIPFIYQTAVKERNPKIRSLYLEAIGRIPTDVALKALCQRAVEDDSVGIREQALVLLSQDHYNAGSAVAVLSFYLASESNAYVQRAAFGIGELGNEQATLALVNALVTKHIVKAGAQGGRINPAFGGDGSVNGLSMGGDTKPVIRSFQNQAVVNALQKITGEDFGFNGPAWTNWYITNHTHHDVQVRR